MLTAIVCGESVCDCGDDDDPLGHLYSIISLFQEIKMLEIRIYFLTKLNEQEGSPLT